MRHLTLDKYCAKSGLKVDTVRGYIKNGKWIKGKQYNKPEGIILVDLEGVNSWVEEAAALEQRVKRVSKSRSNTGATGVARALSLSPPPLI